LFSGHPAMTLKRSLDALIALLNFSARLNFCHGFGVPRDSTQMN
jgi:hypothetical protein